MWFDFEPHFENGIIKYVMLVFSTWTFFSLAQNHNLEIYPCWSIHLQFVHLLHVLSYHNFINSTVNGISVFLTFFHKNSDIGNIILCRWLCIIYKSIYKCILYIQEFICILTLYILLHICRTFSGVGLLGYTCMVNL